MDNRVSKVGSTVDVESATYTDSIGYSELAIFWDDQDFSNDEHAFYYVRVLEIPTSRWTAFDAKYFRLDLPNEIDIITQDRIYCSPISYTP